MKLDLGLICSMSIVFAFLFGFAKEGYSGEVRGVTADTIKVGVILAQTGPAAPLTVLGSDAIKTYARHVNEQGGVHGRRLKIIIEDDRYTIPAAIAVFKKLVFKDDIFVLMGPSSASSLNVIWKSIQKNKIPTIGIPMPKVAVVPFKKYIFITTDTYDGQIKVLIDYMIHDTKLKKPRIGVVYPDTEAGKIEFVPALERLKKYNIKPVTTEVLNPGAIESSSQVMNLKRYNIDCVLHTGAITPTAITLLRDLKKFGLRIPVFAGWGGMLGEELHSIGEAANNIYSVHAISPWYDRGSGLKKMREVTLKYYPGTEKPCRGTVYSLGWTCFAVLLEGLNRTGKNLNEEALIKALESIKNYNTGGLSGSITYSSTSHKGGDSWKIYKADPAAKKYVPLTGWRTPKQQF